MTVVLFVGHTVSAGVSVDWFKIEAVQSTPIPTNRTELDKFLGIMFPNLYSKQPKEKVLSNCWWERSCI